MIEEVEVSKTLQILLTIVRDTYLHVRSRRSIRQRHRLYPRRPFRFLPLRILSFRGLRFFVSPVHFQAYICLFLVFTVHSQAYICLFSFLAYVLRPTSAYFRPCKNARYRNTFVNIPFDFQLAFDRSMFDFSSATDSISSTDYVYSTSSTLADHQGSQ